MSLWLPVWPKTYFPGHAENRMSGEGDLNRAYQEFHRSRRNNLRFLLGNRYRWMNRFIRSGGTVVEIGAGIGASGDFIDAEIIMAEMSPHPWIDVCADGLDLPFGAETIDTIICANVLHHVATPLKFILEMRRCLKRGGYVLIVEPNPSLVLLLALRLMRHEGWSFDIDVFDPEMPANDPADPWSGNNAISYLMFRDHEAFEAHASGLEIVYDDFAECLMLPLSGGVTAKTRTVELPVPLLKIVDRIDRALCRLEPMIFAVRRSLVLRKVGG